MRATDLRDDITGSVVLPTKFFQTPKGSTLYVAGGRPPFVDGLCWVGNNFEGAIGNIGIVRAEDRRFWWLQFVGDWRWQRISKHRPWPWRDEVSAVVIVEFP
jgi:hypothetical protein